MSFFLLLNINDILKKVENHTVSGPQWLTQYFFSFYQSQCGPATVWLPTFFKIPYFVFSTRKKWIQVWDNMWVSKYNDRNKIVGWTIPLITEVLLGRLFRARSSGVQGAEKAHVWPPLNETFNRKAFKTRTEVVNKTFFCFERVNSLICLIHHVVHLFWCHIYRMRSNLRSTGELRNSSEWNTELCKIMISYRLKYNKYR